MAVNATGRAVLRASYDLFRQDSQMIWLPVISIASSLTALGTFVGIGALMGSAPATVVFILLGVVVGNFLGTTCTVALVFGATDRINGVTPTVSGCLSQAWARRDVILRWTLLSVVVGTAIRAIEERLGAVGRILGFLGNLSWAVASFLVVPVLAFENVGPIEAVKRSSKLVKERFGTVGRSGLRFGMLFMAPVVACVVILAFGAAVIKTSPIAGVTMCSIAFVALIGVSIYAGAASVYMRTVLYRYSTGQSVPNLGVDLSTALVSSSPRRFFN